MLNSGSGWGGVAAGFMVSNELLLVTGAFVGASGAILAYIMCQAMNLDILRVRYFFSFFSRWRIAAASDWLRCGKPQWTPPPPLPGE